MSESSFPAPILEDAVLAGHWAPGSSCTSTSGLSSSGPAYSRCFRESGLRRREEAERSGGVCRASPQKGLTHDAPVFLSGLHN